MIKFGTDGWRAVIAEDFTFENVRILTQAVADYIKTKSKKSISIAVGYDARFLSFAFAREVSKVLAANNIKVFLSGRIITTPAVSFLVKMKKLDLGIVITASHNPQEFNGYKIKTNTGGGADSSITSAIESFLYKNQPKKLRKHQQKNIKIIDFNKGYLKFLKKYLNFGLLKRKKFKVMVDMMHGSGLDYMLEVLKGTDQGVKLINAEVNPSFGGRNPEPLAHNLSELMRRVPKEKFDLGLAIDGDGDRIGAVDSKGEFISAQRILPLLLMHLVKNKKMRGDVVTTICGSTLIHRLAQHYGLKLHETPVGFKHITHLMDTEDILIGGEEAGGIGFKNYIPERDGILSGILLIELMAAEKKPISRILADLEKRFGKYYYLKDSFKLKSKPKMNRLKRPREIMGKRVVEVRDYDGVKFICEDQSWIMLRASGTEPIMRFYAESKSLRKSKALLKIGESWARRLVR